MPYPSAEKMALVVLWVGNLLKTTTINKTLSEIEKCKSRRMKAMCLAIVVEQTDDSNYEIIEMLSGIFTVSCSCMCIMTLSWYGCDAFKPVMMMVAGLYLFFICRDGYTQFHSEIIIAQMISSDTALLMDFYVLAGIGTMFPDIEKRLEIIASCGEAMDACTCILPMKFKSIIIYSMCIMEWQVLHSFLEEDIRDVFSIMAKTLEINHTLENQSSGYENRISDHKIGRMKLVVAAATGKKYPLSNEKFIRDDWEYDISMPLTELFSIGMIENIPVGWMRPNWNEDVAGHSIPLHNYDEHADTSAVEEADTNLFLEQLG